MKKQIQKLKFVDSIHEQREMNNKYVPKKGTWVEIGKFTPVIESFDIKERWKCVQQIKKKGVITVELKRVNHKKQEEQSKKIIEEIMEKHGKLLVESMVIMIIKGIRDRQEEIERITAKIKLRKDPTLLKRWENINNLRREEIRERIKIRKSKGKIKTIKNKMVILEKEEKENAKQNNTGHLEITPERVEIHIE